MKTFTLRCGKFIQNTMHQILSQSAEFCKRYDKNIVASLLLGHRVYVYRLQSDTNTARLKQW